MTIKEIIKEAAILDVRTPQEFNEGHYEGAINIPVDTLVARINEIKQMNKPVVAYCRSGARSGLAVSILKQSGLNEVYNGGGLYDILQLRNN